MGLFNLFKKKEKTHICARCKKEITDAESKWIGSHRFCSDCAAPPKNVNIAPKQENAPRTICLFHEGDQYHGTHIELKIENNNEICIEDTGWWPAHRGASNSGCITTNLDADYFQKNTIDEFIAFLSSEKKQDFSHLKNRADVNALFQKKNEMIFKMITKEGQSHNFSYLNQTRYSPNPSSTCGYGSDDWMYLCKENDRYYLLVFSDDASYGTGWMCTELLNGDFENLVKEDVNYWGSITYSKERTKTYAIRLTDVDSVRHLLPTSSRCCSKLTDEHYLR